MDEVARLDRLARRRPQRVTLGQVEEVILGRGGRAGVARDRGVRLVDGRRFAVPAYDAVGGGGTGLVTAPALSQVRDSARLAGRDVHAAGRPEHLRAHYARGRRRAA